MVFILQLMLFWLITLIIRTVIDAIKDFDFTKKQDGYETYNPKKDKVVVRRNNYGEYCVYIIHK